MNDSFAAFVQTHHLIEEGDLVLCGTSGGPDSMALAHLLCDYAKKVPFSLRIVHIHHGLRGADADADALFVEGWAKENGLPCDVVYADVSGRARAEGLSVEEAGRIVRREALEEVADQCIASGGNRESTLHAGGRVKIALAHHADDRAETVLFMLARGSGLAGFAGIRPVAGRYIHPMLYASRDEIMAYLSKVGQPYRIDATNDADDYTRNKIRHHIMPYLEAEVSSGATRHINAAADIAGELLLFVEEEARLRASRYVTCNLITDDMVRTETSIMQSYIVREAVGRLSPGLKDITKGHIEDIIGLFGKPPGKEIHLPGGLTALRCEDGVLLS